jgi:hypothetical protein
MNKDYDIKPVKTSKDSIRHPKLSEEGVIPKLNCSTVLVGKSGSGKTVLLHNLLTRKEFFHGFYDKTFLISPTGETDDVQKALNIPPSCVFTDLEEAVQCLDKIEKFQEAEIKKKGSDGSQKFCIVFDDVVGNTKFMNSPQFIGAFIKARHYNFSVFFCTQHWKKLPKICRMQASYMCFFAISNNEAECMASEFSPPRMPKNNFMQLIDDALKDGPYSFLTINMKAPWESRFRRNLANVINLDDYRKGMISTPSSRDSSPACEQTDDEPPDPLVAK